MNAKGTARSETPSGRVSMLWLLPPPLLSIDWPTRRDTMSTAASPLPLVRRHPMTDADVTRIADAADGWARDAMIAHLIARLNALPSKPGAGVRADWREHPPCTGSDA